jgi:hypothetical protein
LAYSRAGKERGVRRAPRASRHLSRVERRRTAVAVAKALAREQGKVEPQRRQVQFEPLPRAEAPAAPANAPVAAADAILSPNFVQTIDLRRPRLDAGLIADSDASAQRTTAPEPAASVQNTGQAPPQSPALAGPADNAAEIGQARIEPVQAAASGPSDSADLPWLRFAFLAFGGMLALGSAIRLFV